MMLACQILETGKWPNLWLRHWIVPLHKKKAVFQPGNYRGVHLTAQLSKATERLLGLLWLPKLAKEPGFFGPNQFAYLPERGARDALAVMVTTWLLGFQRGRKFGLYCSDVSGAFDKVDAARLVAKLRAKGFQENILRVIASWLQKRSAQVLVGGACSDPMELVNQVFQGTVWGPSLWNLFFEDARCALEVLSFVVVVFADDLNSYKPFSRDVDNDSILAELRAAQSKLHEWGRGNRVGFDASKESMHVLSRSDPIGSNFKILGVNFDCKLVMEDAAHDVSVECGWKLETMLRGRKFYCGAELISLYKSHVLSFIEYRTSAIYHASTTVLSQIDNVQARMLRIADVEDLEALFAFNLAPLRTRRDLAMLGVVHRAVIGKGPRQLSAFFSRRGSTWASRTRMQGSRHGMQLEEYRNGDQTEYIRRSVLGLVTIYNLLPCFVVHAETVSIFQSRLQDVLKERALAGCADWAETFSPRVDLGQHPLMANRW
jgi:hypothetical protein